MKKILKKLLHYSQVYAENEQLKAQVIPLREHASAAYEELAKAWEMVQYLTSQKQDADDQLKELYRVNRALREKIKTLENTDTHETTEKTIEPQSMDGGI